MMEWVLLCVLAAGPAGSAPASPPAKKPSRTQALVKEIQRADAPSSAVADAEEEPLPPAFQWVVPGLLSWVDSDGPMVSNGVPVLLQLARSSRPVPELERHFISSFEKAGLFIPREEEQVRMTREPQLTALDPMRMLSYTVILQANPDRTTTVILGTANVGALENVNASQTLGWAPVMPGAEKLLRTEAEGYASAAYQVESTVEKVRAFYQEALPRAGFVPVPKEEGLYRRGDESLQVRSRPDEQSSGSVMVWLVRRQGGLELDAQAPEPKAGITAPSRPPPTAPERAPRKP
ncbi:MAG TPA: hypothetical protein VEY88_16765 [Archangium sp.]|nr:hypothetical protein [Archangium sp.]